MKCIFAIAIVVAGLTLPAGRVSADYTVTASADCSTFQVDVSADPDTYVYVTIGSQPPSRFAGGVTGDFTIGLYESNHSFYASVKVSQPGTTDVVTLYNHYVDCTPEQSDIGNPDPEIIPAPVPDPVVEDVVEVEPLLLDQWAHIAMAPPW